MADRYIGLPMDLANMRQNGCRSIMLDCACGHEATVNVDQFAGSLHVTDMRLKFRCSKCGQRPRSSRPNSLELGGTRDRFRY